MVEYKRINSWRWIRGIGNLTVLTRASYIALLIVPLIAGMWPAVRGAINKYNNSIQRGQNGLATLRLDLAEILNNLDVKLGELGSTEAAIDARDKLIAISTTAEESLKSVETELSESTVRNKRLPPSYVSIYPFRTSGCARALFL